MPSSHSSIVIPLFFAVACLLITGCNSEKTPTSSRVEDKAPHKNDSQLPDVAPASSSFEYQPGDWFEDVTPRSGVHAIFQTGKEAERNTILETVGGGVAVLDYDRDSFADLLFIGGGAIDAATAEPSGVPSRLYRNLSNWRFQEASSAAGVPEQSDYSHGCIAADINNDGFSDLLITCYGQNQILINLGDGTFEDVSAKSEMVAESWHTAAASGDFNRDGFPDFYVANYVNWKPKLDEACFASQADLPDVCPPQNYDALPDEVFLSQGDGTFRNISSVTGNASNGKGLGVLIGDWNAAGTSQVYVANDVVQNFMFFPDASAVWTEEGEINGSAFNEAGTPEGSMGIDAADVNGDGLLDLWVTNYELEDNSLYENLGNGQFQHATARFGLAGMCRPYVGFGTGFLDFDSDSWPDLYVLNGHVQYHSAVAGFRQPSFLFRNEHGKRFSDVGKEAGTWFQAQHAARGGAAGDLDNDGTFDLVTTSLDEPAALLRNRIPPNQFVRIQLVGTVGTRDAIGAQVRYRAFGREVHQFVKSGSGYLSQSDFRLILAFDQNDKNTEVIVTWPSGHEEVYRDLESQSDHVLVEGKGDPT